MLFLLFVFCFLAMTFGLMWEEFVRPMGPGGLGATLLAALLATVVVHGVFSDCPGSAGYSACTPFYFEEGSFWNEFLF